MDRALLQAVAERWMRLHEAYRGRCYDTEFAALHAPEFRDGSPAGRETGRDAYQASLAEWYRAFPDLEVHVDDLVIDPVQNKVAIRWSAEGTHRHTFLGVSPTGRRTQFRGIEIITVADGALVERWGDWDGLDLLAQLRGGRPGG